MNTTTTPSPDQLLTTDDTCEMLRVDRSTLYKWWSRGVGPIRIMLPNGKSRVRREAYDEFLLSLEVAA